MALNNPSTGPGSTNVRQSTRQTRTNPSRVSKTAGRTSLVGLNSNNPTGSGGGGAAGGGSMGGGNQANSMPHGLYPGITHFSDAIDALPREFRRHNSLLSEVDGKAWALEEHLPKLLNVASEMINKDVFEKSKPGSAQKITETPELTNRRQVFQNIRSTLSDLLGTIDEKNHVARNANMALKKDVARLDAVYPYVQREVSDEARLGSLTHWAYLNKPAAKANTGNERPRRETAGTNHQRGTAHHDADAHEPKREPTTRRQRRNQVDHDADELRAPPSRKGKSGPKGRAAADSEHNAGTGSGANPTTKRRKVDTSQAIATAAAMERSVSAATNTTGRGAAKDLATAETGKKRTRAPNAGTAGTRKRTNTVASTAGSPPLVPLPGIPSQAMSAKASSPAPSVRSQVSRQHQASAQTTTSRQRPSSSASSRMPNSSMFSGLGLNPLDPHSNEPHTAEKGTLEARSMATAKDLIGLKGDPMSRTGAMNGDNKPSTALSSSRPTDLDLKREDGIRAMSTVSGTDNYQNNIGSKRELSQGIDTTAAITTMKSRSSKTSTPVTSTFTETQRTTRPSRTGDGPATKRANKKAGPNNANVSRQATAQAAATASTLAMQEVGPDLPIPEDEDDEFEPRYCYCNEVSFGEMVACDNPSCPREWFHLSCVGMTRPPSKSVVWYCNECKDALKKGRGGGK